MLITIEDISALCQKFWDYWGEDKQLNMVEEECAELILAIRKYKRKKSKKDSDLDKANIDHIIEEASDVFNMVMAIRNIDSEKFDRIVNDKLKRTYLKLIESKEKEMLDKLTK